MIKKIFLVFAIFLLTGGVSFSASKFMSPTGTDNATCGQTTPCKTFAHTLPKMNSGETLWLYKGIYDDATTGLINADCDAQGLADYVTVRASTMRRARINGYVPGKNTVKIHHCTGWTVEGLVMAKRKFDSDGQNSTAVNVDVKYSPYTTFRRNVFLGAPGGVTDCPECRPMTLNIRDDSHYALLEGNEGYHCSRDCFNMKYNFGGIARGNYVNVRGAGEATSGSGRTIFMNYPAEGWLWENNIAEGADDGNGNAYGCASYPRSGGPGRTCTGNTWLGNISLQSRIGMSFRIADGGAVAAPLNNVIQDHLVIGDAGFTGTGMIIRDSENTRTSRLSIFNVNGGGLAVQYTSLGGLEVENTFYGDSILLLNNESTGLYIHSNVDDWHVDGLQVYGNSPDYSAVGSGNCDHCTNVTNQDPGLGSCKVYAGRGHGASVVYRYVNGVLTTQPLWTTTPPSGYTGPSQPYYWGWCGTVTLEAENTNPLTSCSGVASRLNVVAQCLPY